MTTPTALDPMVRISEIFGPTIQGEGPAAGRRAVFIRFAGCPVGCTWCDTRYSWDPAARDPSRAPRSATVGMVAAQATRISAPTDILVVTGGEPLAQPEALGSLVARLKQQRPHVHLESAGMPGMRRELLREFELVVLSPKLRNAGDRASEHMASCHYEAAAALENCWFKFVVSSRSDLDEIARMESALGLERIVVMAEGTDPCRSLAATAALSEEVISRGWSISPRLHLWLWGDQPGR